MLTVRPHRMFRNKKFHTCRWGHDWAYIQHTNRAEDKLKTVTLNRGVRICKDCKRQKVIRNFIATMKARERRILYS